MELPQTLTDVAARFPLTTSIVDIHGRAWRITSVQDQDALLEEVVSDEDLENFPYGLLLWASAIGLARRVARDPALLAGKRVLEIGAGVGLSGLVATVTAATVVQTDYQEAALALCAHNAVANGITAGITQAKADWRAFPADLGQPFDVVIGSDILYERTLHANLLELLPTLVRPGGLLIVSDPQRPQATDFWVRFRAEQSACWEPITQETERVRFEGQDKEILLHSVRRRKAEGTDSTPG